MFERNPALFSDAAPEYAVSITREKVIRPAGKDWSPGQGNLGNGRRVIRYPDAMLQAPPIAFAISGA
jgi:hypothetical protein